MTTRRRGAVGAILLLVWIGAQIFGTYCYAADVFDLCVQGRGHQFVKSIHLQLRLEGSTLDDGGKLLGAEITRRRIWKSTKGVTAFAEPYEESLCKGARSAYVVEMNLDASDAARLRRLRGNSEHANSDLAALTSRAKVTRSPSKKIVRANGKPYDVLYVQFATNREVKQTGSEVGDFTATWSQKLTYGGVEVAIPENRAIGELESPFWRRLRFWDDTIEPVAIEAGSLQVMSKDRWTKQLHAMGEKFGRPGLLLFVHGYNVPFKDAARRTAQIARDTGFNGPTMFFSWASQGGMGSYMTDRETADLSVTQMYSLLKDLAIVFSDGPIFVIAHSMGSQVVTKAFVRLSKEAPALKSSFRELVLAAPDLDVRLFENEIAVPLLTGVPHVTLYTNINDKALQISAGAQGGVRRLGQGGKEIVIKENMDSIDASAIQSDYFIEHSYFGNSLRVLFDISYLIREQLPPKRRAGLKLVETVRGQYWRFSP